jgi:DNA-binding phage protein
MANIRRASLLLASVLAVLLGYAVAASAATDVGYRDGSFNATSVDAPTGEKPQSKLWYNDGTWWGSMFNTSTEEFHIYRLDRASQSWSDTGTLIDERNSSKADTLWDGSHLYVATAGPTSASSHSGRVLRYSYDAATKKYSLDAGFPVTVTSGGMEAIVLDKDSTGKLWVTYTQNNRVYINHSLGDDQSWGTPFVLPVNGSTVGADDIAGVAAFDTQTAAPQVGVMWSNQVDDAMYFATHRDGDADNVWQGSSTAIQGPKTADDHISIRSVQADDVSGRVFVAVKTSLGDLQNADTNAPLILLLVRDQAGNWTNYRVGRVIDHHTRPIVMIDQEHRNLYVFATHDENCGAIYYKKTPMSNISFSEGVGTPFIQSSTDTCVNNATSTKQNVNSATGLPVLASDNTSKNYLHNIMDLSDADTVAPTVGSVAPAGGATDVAAAANVEATFSEAMDPATVTGSTFTLTKQGSSQAVAAQVGYDAATKKATLDPQVDLDPSSSYTATLKSGISGVKDLAGNPLAQDKTWSFTTASATPPQDTTPPETGIDAGPSGTVSSSSASFTFSSNEAGSTFECSLDAGAFGSCSSPKSYTGLSDGSHTFSVRAIDTAGNIDATPATRAWTVNTTPPVVQSASLAPVADAGLTELSPTANNGSATTLGVDGVDPDPNGGDLYAALRWDLSQIPTGATVSGATVTLNVTNSTVQTYAAYELKKAWSEGQVNWSQAATGSPWATAGAKGATDRGTKIADVAPTKKASYTFTIPASVVQGWLDNPSSSNGILLADPTAGTTNWDLFAFDTREGATPPKLSVTYTGGTDTSPPETTIDSGPSGTFTNSSASLTFSSNEAGSTFECSLDAGAFGGCSSPKSYTGLSEGPHTFSVRATDAAGNVDATPATRTWTVNTTPPVVQSASLAPVADAGLAELSPTANNGSATTLKVDGVDPDPNGGDLYAALRWDLSQIPAGATIQDAKVTLNVTNPSTQAYGAYDLKKAWSEGQVNWNQAATGSPWQTIGAKGTTDRGTKIASVTPTAIAPYTFTIPAAVVQGWVSTPSTSNGILISHTTNDDGFIFDTREGATPPKLTVNYSTP